MASQNEEDDIIASIVAKLGLKEGSFFEIGVNDLGPGGNLECNTTALLAAGWQGFWVDANFKHPAVTNFFVTEQNILSALDECGYSEQLDFFSIDIDSSDWYVVRRVLESGCKVRFFCTEVNGYHDKWADLIMAPGHERPRKSRCFGATLLSYQKLFARFGYTLVAVTENGVNAFWVRSEDAHLFENSGDYDFHFRRTDLQNNWNTSNPSDRYTTAEAQLAAPV